jgi:hypothetical protein
VIANCYCEEKCHRSRGPIRGFAVTSCLVSLGTPRLGATSMTGGPPDRPLLYHDPVLAAKHAEADYPLDDQVC